MSKSFYNRFYEYLLEVSKALEGISKSANIFPNSTDVGVSREKLYMEFIKTHAPSHCNVFLGGFLFGENGDESKQIDIIINTDTSPNYNFHNNDGRGKSFAPAKGCLGAISVKSFLNHNELLDSLHNIASIPFIELSSVKVLPDVTVKEFENWPYKVIYASNGLSGETILDHVNKFYETNSHIPVSRRPDIIHVLGKYIIIKKSNAVNFVDANNNEVNIPYGGYKLEFKNSDIYGLLIVIQELQFRASATKYIYFEYSYIVNNLIEKKNLGEF